MPRRSGRYGFNLATIVQVGLIPLITVVGIMVGFYYTTGDALRRHEIELGDLRKTDDKNGRAREQIAKQFLEYQQKNNEILGKLDTRLAVSETKQEIANQTLGRIAEELARINSASPRHP